LAATVADVAKAPGRAAPHEASRGKRRSGERRIGFTYVGKLASVGTRMRLRKA